MRVKDSDLPNDDISKSTTSDMFAFSQIIASGDKVSDITRELENVGQNLEKDNDEDNAILAFSNTLPGNDDEPITVMMDEET